MPFQVSPCPCWCYNIAENSRDLCSVASQLSILNLAVVSVLLPGQSEMGREIVAFQMGHEILVFQMGGEIGAFQMGREIAAFQLGRKIVAFRWAVTLERFRWAVR